MKPYLKHTAKLLMLGVAVTLFQACSIKIPVDSPKVSETAYPAATPQKEVDVQFESALSKDHEVAAGERTGVFKLEHDGKKIDADDFIKSGLKNELAARTIPLRFTTPAEDKLTLEHFEIITHRVSGFSPLVTVSTLKVTMKVDGKEKEFVSMIKRAKTPVWSMNEVFDPCYNEATTLLIKEIVAKINKAYFGRLFNDQYIETLEQKISAKTNARGTYMDVYELGFSNNKKSLPFLKTLTSNPDEYIRLAAISSIGILGDETELPFLVSLNQNATSWQDKAMALKAIGDLNTQKSRDYLKERKTHWDGQAGTEALWSLKIINLYL